MKIWWYIRRERRGKMLRRLFKFSLCHLLNMIFDKLSHHLRASVCLCAAWREQCSSHRVLWRFLKIQLMDFGHSRSAVICWIGKYSKIFLFSRTLLMKVQYHPFQVDLENWEKFWPKKLEIIFDPLCCA